MPDDERASTKHKRTAHLANPSGLVISSEDRHFDSHKFENRSDRDDSYDYSHGSSRTAREERGPRQRYPQSDRTRHNHRYADSEDRLSGSVMKDHHWTSHDRTKTINSRSHERFNRVDDVSYGRDSSNGLPNTIRNTPNERRQIRGQERYHRKDEPGIALEKRHHWDNEVLKKNNDDYKPKVEEHECQEAKSPAACYSSSDVISFKARYKDQGISDDLDEQMHHPYTADRRSERHRHGLRQSSSRGRSSRGSSPSVSSASVGTDDSRETDALKEGSSYGRRLSFRDRRRSPSPSGSPHRSDSRHSGIRSKSHSSVKKDSRSSHGHKHSGKRKHRDRSASPDDRKRRKRKEREREKDKEISRERKKDEERRSVLTGKKIKLKVKKDKGDHERDANRKDLLQFLNSAFE